MKKNSATYKYIQWCSPQELHKDCLDWISTLEFIKDEQRFLNDVIKNRTLDLIAGPLYARAVYFTDQLHSEETQIEQLLIKLHKHRNDLVLLLDGIDQIAQEKKYREAHFQLKIEVTSYEFDYRCIKKELFNMVAEIMRMHPPKRITK